MYNCQKHNDTKLFILTCKAGIQAGCSGPRKAKHMPLHRSSNGPRESSRGSFRRRIAAAVCFCLPAGVSHPACIPADF